MKEHAWSALSGELIDDIDAFFEQLSEVKTPTVHTGNFAKLKAQELKGRLDRYKVVSNKRICPDCGKLDIENGCDGIFHAF